MDETTVKVTAAGGDYFFTDDLSVYSSPLSVASSPAVLPQIVVLTTAPTTKYEVTVTPNKSDSHTFSSLSSSLVDLTASPENKTQETPENPSIIELASESNRTIVSQLINENNPSVKSESSSSSPAKSEVSLPLKIEPQPPSAAAIANIPSSITSSPQYQKEYNEYYTKYYATYYNHYFQAGYSNTDNNKEANNTSEQSVKSESATSPATSAAANAYAHHYASYYAAQHAAASAAHKQQQANGNANSTPVTPNTNPPASSTPSASNDNSSVASNYSSGGQFFQSSNPGYSYGSYPYNASSTAQPSNSALPSTSNPTHTHTNNTAHSSHSSTSGGYCSCASCVAQAGSKSSSHSGDGYAYSYGSKSSSGPCNCSSCQAAASGATDKSASKHGSYSSCPCPACAQSRSTSYQYSSSCNCSSCLAQRASGNGSAQSSSKSGKDKDSSSHNSSNGLKSINAPQTPQAHHHSSGSQTPGSSAPGSSKKAPKSAKKSTAPGSASKVAPLVLEVPKSAKKDKASKDKEREKEKEKDKERDKEKSKDKEKKSKDKEKEKDRESDKDRHGGLNIGQLDLHSTDDLIHLPGDEHVDSILLASSGQSALASRTHSPSLSPALSSSPHPFDPTVFAAIVPPTFSPALPSLHSPTASPPLTSLLTGSVFPAPFPRSPRLSFMRDVPSNQVNSNSIGSNSGGPNGFSFFSPSPATRSPKFGLFSTLLNSPSPAFALPSPSLPALLKNPLDLRKSPHIGTSSLQSMAKSESKAASPDLTGNDGKSLHNSVSLPRTPSQNFLRSPISIAINARSQSPELISLGKNAGDDKANLSILDKLQSLQNIRMEESVIAMENSKKRQRSESADLLLAEHLGTPKLKSSSVSSLILSHSPTLLPLPGSPLITSSSLQLQPQRSCILAMCHQCKVRKPVLSLVYCCNHSKNRRKYKVELLAQQSAQEKKELEAKLGKGLTDHNAVQAFAPLPSLNLSAQSCPHRYCEGCLLKHYGEKAPAKRPPVSSWSCPKCRGSCSCRKCKIEREKVRNYADPSTMPPAVALASALVYAGQELNTEMRAFREEAERELAANPRLLESYGESDDDILNVLESEAESLSPSDGEGENENFAHMSKRKKSSSVLSTPRVGAIRRPTSRRSNGATPLLLSSSASPSTRSKISSSSGLGALELPPSAFLPSSDPHQTIKTDSLLAVVQQAKFEQQSPLSHSASLFAPVNELTLKVDSVVTQSPQMRAMLEAASIAQPAPLDLSLAPKSL
jgi:hypothetical protein